MANPILVYVNSRVPQGIQPAADPVVVLAKDNWDDYTFKTTFEVFLLRGQERDHIGAIRLLVDKAKETSPLLDAAPPATVGGRSLNFGGRNYLSLGTGLDYYKELIRLMSDRNEREQVLAALHDTVFLEQRQPDSPDLHLRRTEGFRKSLLRGPNETKVYGQARQVLFADELRPDRFNFTLRYWLPPFSSPHEFRFRFEPDVDQSVPTNIAVLIGKNGLGKTQALYHTADYLLGERRGEPEALRGLAFVPIEPRPPFRHIVAVSFSPFEQFPLKLPPPAAGQVAANADDLVSFSSRYTYCGFRGTDTGPAASPDNAERVAWQRTWQALIDILQHDEDQLQKLGGSDRPKFSALLKVLKEGLGYESLLVRLQNDQPVGGLLAFAVEDFEGQRYLNIRTAEDHDRTQLLLVLRTMPESGDLRFKDDDGTLVGRFSAGQAMFLFIVFGVIAGVQRDSLLLVDEPELYLHPNLEVAYLRMLTTLLQLFESYAIIATHSAFVAREVPARNVFVVSEGTGRRPLVDTPSMETFGADITQIVNLVFDNISADKPFQQWLRTLIRGDENYATIRARLSGHLNIESLTFLRNEIADRTEAAEQQARDDQAPQGPGRDEEA